MAFKRLLGLAEIAAGLVLAIPSIDVGARVDPLVTISSRQALWLM